MYVTIRRYSNAKALIDAMTAKPADVQKVISSVPGFVSYHAIKDGDNMTSMTICNDEAGTEESTKRAAAWVKENVKATGMGAPQIHSGEVFLSFPATRVRYMK